MMKIALTVIDANDVSGSSWSGERQESPLLHPAIQNLIDGFAGRPDLECYVIYGGSALSSLTVRREKNIIYTGVPYRRLFFPGGALIAKFIALRHYLKQLKPDLVHAQGTERESALVAAFSGFKSALTLHGNFREIRKVFKAGFFSYYGLAAALETMALKKVDALICISSYVEEITAVFKVTKFRIPNAVSEKYLTAKRPSRQSNLKRICCMGTIDARKRPHLVLEACALLWEKEQRFILDFYGSLKKGDTYAESFLEKLQPWIKKKRVFYHGFTAHPLEVILQSDLMVSASSEESFGMNILEAMAAGTPVIGPALGGIQEIIIDEETGFLYKKNDVKECAEKIERLLKNEALWSQMSEAGRVRAKSFYAPSLIAEKTIEVYHSILNQKKLCEV